MPAVRKITGRVQPRLWTPPLRPLSKRTSNGYAIAEFADTVGEPFLPWQRWLAIHAMELLPDFSYRFRVVVVLVARQNGKSSVKRTISLWRLHVDGARLVLGVAQDVSLAREQWQMALDTIQASPDLSEDLGQVRRVNGDEWFRLNAGLDASEDDGDREINYDDDDDDESFTLDGGGRYKIAASNRKAGRGLSVDELNIDELREQRNWQAWSALSKTTMARPLAQIWCMSNAGDDQSVVLNQLRDAALSGRDPSIGLFEWSAPDGCELDDPRAWAAANPGLGHTIGEEAIRSALTTDPPAVFRTEVLCQRVDQLDGAIDMAAWRDCADTGGTMDAHRQRIVVCLDVAPDSQHATLAAAARMADGRARIEIIADWTSTEELRRDWPGLIARVKPRIIGWYPSGPAAALASLMRPNIPAWSRTSETPDYTEIKGAQANEACQEMADLVRNRQIVHSADPLLDAHVRGAQKLPSIDGWRFTRKGVGHVDAAYAAAGAVRLALSNPEPPKAAVRVVG